jgi:hypothetical protein
MTTTSTHDALVEMFQGMSAETLDQLQEQVRDVLPDLSAALNDLAGGRSGTAARQLAVTAEYLRARLAAIDEALAAKTLTTQSN